MAIKRVAAQIEIVVEENNVIKICVCLFAREKIVLMEDIVFQDQNVIQMV